MKTNLWHQPAGEQLRQALSAEARSYQALHQPPRDLDTWKRLRDDLRETICERAGIDPSDCDLAITTHGEIKRPGYTITKITYQSRPGFRVTANLYKPDGDGPFPAILNVHGHWPTGKSSPVVAARGHSYVQAGYVVIIVDAFGSGERGTVAGECEYHGAQLGMSLMSIGKTLLGIQVEDNMRAIDLLCSLPYVDDERIGVTGASGGGNQTMWVAAMDDRVKASAPAVSVGTFEAYIGACNCVCETLPDGLSLMEEWAILALAAPNAMMVMTALREYNRSFQVQEMVQSVDLAQTIYALYGERSKIAYSLYDQEHGYSIEMRRQVIGWFDLWLKGEGSGLPREEQPFEDLPEPELRCFPDGKRPAEVMSILDYLKAFTPEPELDGCDLETLRVELDDCLKSSLVMTSLRAIDRQVRQEDGHHVVSFIIEVESGVMLPCQLIRSKKAAETVVVAVSPAGKSTIVDSEQVKAALAAGKDVCLVDLRGTGETRWYTAPEERPDFAEHDSARAAIWLGRTMIGDWAKDLRAVIEELTTEDIAVEWQGGEEISAPAYQSVELLTWDEQGLAAIAVAALGDDESISAISTCNCPASWKVLDGRPTLSHAAFVPHILTWGDVDLMVALASCPVSFDKPVTMSGAVLEAADLDALTARITALKSELN